MDELELIRQLRPEPQAPGPEVVSAARKRMREDNRRRFLTRRRTGALVLGACAAATAVVVTITLIPASTPPAPRTNAGSGLPVFTLPSGAARNHGGSSGAAARQILLDAAQTVALGKPPPQGRYWEIPAVAGNFIPVGPGHQSYLILEKTTYDLFMDRLRRSSPQVVSELGVELASRADRAAWRRAGSPKSWPVNQEFGLGTPYGPPFEQAHYNVTTGRGPLFDTTTLTGAQPFPVGNSFLSYRQLLALPASPRALKKLLLKRWFPGYLGKSTFLFQTVPNVLDMPVTPAVRAALYRMLAGLPGVRGVGQVQDVAGRRGLAVTLTGRYAKCGQYKPGHFVKTHTERVRARDKDGKRVWAKVQVGYTVPRYLFSSCLVQQRLIINPATGLPLSQELRYSKLPPGQHWSAPGGLFSYELYGTPKWTAKLPHRDSHAR